MNVDPDVDVLAIGAHPDDVELGVGGLVHKLATRGYRVGILDLTRGEMSSRGTPEERATEADHAARVLQVTRRENAGLPDGGLVYNAEQQRSVIELLRSFRPRMILAPAPNDRHPDHGVTHQLARAANYFSGLRRIDTGRPPHRATHVYYYHPYHDDAVVPQFVVDISDHFETKIEALRVHASQFFNPDRDDAPTYIASPEFWDSIRIRAAYWGNRIGAVYGEPLVADIPIGVALPPGLEEIS